MAEVPVGVARAAMVSVDIGLTQAKRALKAKAKSGPATTEIGRDSPAAACLDWVVGLEAKCILRIARDSFAGKAHLNTDRVEFRGDTRLDVPFSAIKSAAAGAGGAL